MVKSIIVDDKVEAKSCLQCKSTLQRVDSGKNPLFFCKECGSVPLNTPAAHRPSHERREQLPTTTITTKKSQLIVRWPSALTPNEAVHTYWLIHSGACDNSEIRFSRALAEITRIAVGLGVEKDVAEEAALMFQRAYLKSLVKGHSLEAVAASVLYASLRMNSSGITFDQVTVCSKASRSEISACTRKLQRKLGLKFPVPKPSEFVRRALGVLELSGLNTLTDSTYDLLKQVQSAGADQARNPAGIAAAAIFLATKKHRYPLTQRRIAASCGVTEGTIRNISRDISRFDSARL